MSIFGPGVGGGLLAAAGAAGGLGQGITQEGQEQQKAGLAEKMNALQQAREEAITRLQGSQQSQLEEQRAAHQERDVHEEIAGRSSVAQFEAGQKSSEAQKTRDFAAGQNTQSQASKEKIAAGHDTARVDAAGVHANAAKVPGKEWTYRNVTTAGGIDPVSHMPMNGRSFIVAQHNDGRQFVQVGDKMLPYDASADKVQSADSVRRAPAGAVNDLMNDPTGSTPSGNPKSEVFLQRNGYLPLSYFTALKQTQANSPTGPQASHGFGSAIPRGASVSPPQSFSGGAAEPEEPPDPAESEPDPGQPPSQ